MNLGRLLARLRRDVGGLLWQFQYECPKTTATCALVEDPLRVEAVIRLHDCWVKFCRELVIQSALGGQTAGGAPLTRIPNVARPDDVIAQLRARYPRKPPYWEPRWGDARECGDASRDLNVGNLNTIRAALGATTSPAEELRLVRNYFAHRARDTHQKVRPYAQRRGLPIRFQPEQMLQIAVAPGQVLFEAWVTDLLVVAEASIQ